jgi:tRNA-splicing ligase RtcB
MNMIDIQEIKEITEYEWEIPVSFRSDMQVDVRLFISRAQLEDARSDLSLEQAINASTLPGVVEPVVVMPDVHQGYGFPIGGVAATHYPDGVISPGAIGYDINCGVRLLSSSIYAEDVEDSISDLATVLDRYCPSGIGVKGGYRLSGAELEEVGREGAGWALKKGYALKEDLERTEEEGCMAGADVYHVSKNAKDRGASQLGTLGSGNHFLEVDVVEQVLDEHAAQMLGLFEGMLALQLHCGSRGFGHQICTDYVQDFQGVMAKLGIVLPDRELVCAPIDSKAGSAYLGAMRAAANYAFCNRQLLAHSARRAFEQVFSGKVKNTHLHQVYDITHNIGKIETHRVGDKAVKVCVHRKGATRAFGPGEAGVPREYAAIGQPVLVPGSMGTSSWVLLGTKESMLRSWGSSCHGAGRTMSRSKAKRIFRGEKLKVDLEKRGIRIRAGSMPGLAEEAPHAYKDVDDVVEVVTRAGIARKVARLRPLLVIKG